MASSMKALVLLAFCATGALAAACEDWSGGITMGGHIIEHDCCPLFLASSETPRTYAEATALCAELGATVASIHSKEENEAVKRLLQSPSYLGGFKPWAGADWRWDDGSAYDYTPDGHQFDDYGGYESRLVFSDCLYGRGWHDWGTGDEVDGVVCRRADVCTAPWREKVHDLREAKREAFLKTTARLCEYGELPNSGGHGHWWARNWWWVAGSQVVVWTVLGFACHRARMKSRGWNRGGAQHSALQAELRRNYATQQARMANAQASHAGAAVLPVATGAVVVPQGTVVQQHGAAQQAIMAVQQPKVTAASVVPAAAAAAVVPTSVPMSVPASVPAVGYVPAAAVPGPALGSAMPASTVLL